MAKLPTGTVTILFTDIESSSTLWDTDPDAMARSLELHNEAGAAIIAANGGHVVKTIGDAFMATFARPFDAIRAAVQAQRALAVLDWRSGPALSIRIGIHPGTTEPRDGDYHGPAANRAAADATTPKPFLDWFIRPALDRLREAMGAVAFDAASVSGAASDRETIAAMLGVT